MSSRWATRTRKALPRLARPGQPRILPRLERQAAPARRARAVRLRERGRSRKSLWLAEGVTSYYDRLLVRRAGLCTVEEYLDGRARRPGAGADEPPNDIEALQDTPGRLVQPLESASFDAWIKFYRRDENTPNTAISYYTKGAVVGFLLDAEVRKATDGGKSLDDVMRLAYDRYSGDDGLHPGRVPRDGARGRRRSTSPPGSRRALETTEELDYAEALAWYGLRFKPTEEPTDKDKARSPRRPGSAWSTKPENGRLIVAAVKRGTPGFDAGLQRRRRDRRHRRRAHPARGLVQADGAVPAQREGLGPGRPPRSAPPPRRHLRPPSPPPATGSKLDPAATDEQKAHRKAWLGE